MLPTPAPLYVDTVGVADGGEVGCGQEDITYQHVRQSKGKDKMDEQGPVYNVEKEPPDKVKLNNPHLCNKNQETTDKGSSVHQSTFDEYKEPDSEDDHDEDTQSVEEGMETEVETNISDQHKKNLLLNSSNADEIREVAGKQGLSPRGRKLLKQNKNPSTSKPNTRARSRGF